MATAERAVAWEWPADVLEFARRRGMDQYLGPLAEALDRLFPSARERLVRLERDPDMPDVWAIVFEVTAPQADHPDFLAARAAWYEAKVACLPPAVRLDFVLILDLEP